ARDFVRTATSSPGPRNRRSANRPDGVVRTFRSAASSRPEGLHYIGPEGLHYIRPKACTTSGNRFANGALDEELSPCGGLRRDPARHRLSSIERHIGS